MLKYKIYRKCRPNEYIAYLGKMQDDWVPRGVSLLCPQKMEESEILPQRVWEGFYAEFGGRTDTDYGSYWLYNKTVYRITNNCLTDEECQYFILKEVDKERKDLERLKLCNSGETKIKRQHIPSEVRIYVWRRDKGECVKCSSRNKLEYEHIIPVIKGGSNTERNIELLCESCNRSKGSKIL